MKPNGCIKIVRLLGILAWAGVVFGFGDVIAAADSPPPTYQIYSGNTHAHTAYTWSHGEQWEKNTWAPLLLVGDTAYPNSNAILKSHWQKVQGPPASHFATAKSKGFDFYATTDHSQDASFQPVSPANTNWLDTKRAAAEASDGHFVALAGYEHSENNGPGGKGHLNVINSSTYLNALSPGVDLPYLYQWLKTVPSNGDGPVVASFNHPGARQYNDWAYRDPQITDIITMLEVINSDRAGHYQAFVNALDKGWKVSPVAGADNHGLSGISNRKARTFVLATNLTKAAILDAMQHRRTYASLDGNIQCQYTVNGSIMGSTLDRPVVFKFEISASDVNTNKPGDKITKIDIVKDGGAIAQTFEPAPGYSLRWSPTISDATNKYFFVRIWDAGGGDTAKADSAQPVAWLAPVWTGR
jgi:hypothetical protein